MTFNLGGGRKRAQGSLRGRRALVDPLEPRRLFAGGLQTFEAMATAPNVTMTGVASMPIVVQFFEPTVDTSTFSSSNFLAVCVAGPSMNTSLPVTYVGLDPHDPGAGHGLRIGDYRVDAPGGAWQAADDGNWSIEVLPHQVNDSTFGFLLSLNSSVFQVAVPTPAPMTISTGGAVISQGQSIDVGATLPGVSSAPQSFTITNNSGQILLVSTRLGQGADRAQILTGQSLPNGSIATEIAAGGSSTFTLAIDSAELGAVSDPVEFYASPQSDVPWSVFSFNVTGTVTASLTTATRVALGKSVGRLGAVSSGGTPSAIVPATGSAGPLTSSVPTTGATVRTVSFPAAAGAGLDLPPAIAAGDSPASFIVGYKDQEPDTSTFGDGNLLIAGPNGFLAAARYIGLDPLAGGTMASPTRVADYVLEAPVGGWTAADNGTYTVILQPNQVRDVIDGAFPPGAVGQFTVSLPTAPPISVAVDGSPIAANQSINFASAALPGPGQTRAITFTNTSDEPLFVNLQSAVNSGLGLTGFSTDGVATYFWKAPNPWDGGGIAPPLLPGESETDFVTLNPGPGTVAGPASLAVQLVTDSQFDPSENFAPFGVNLTGQVQTAYPAFSVGVNLPGQTTTPAVSVDQAKHSAVLFVNSAGKLTKLRLTGPGSLQVNFNPTNYFRPDKGTAIPLGDPTSIVLSGTTARSTLQVIGVGAFTISNIGDSAPLGHFQAPNATLLGGFAINGNLGSLTVRALDSSFSANIAGALKSLLIHGQGSGDIAAASIGTIQAASLSGARYFAGANFGADGLPGNDDDTGFPSTLGSLKVTGNVSQSLIAVGLIPADGSFFTATDALTGGGDDRLGHVLIHGTLDSASRIVAVEYGPVRIGGKLVRPAGDVRFMVDANV